MLESIIEYQITPGIFAICFGTSLVLGIGVALLCMFKSRYTQSFALTLAIIPAVVQVIIMLVNGNIGAGVAVAGTFGLVRFRSAPGTGREIAMIFLAMTIGLATGMGYVGLALVFFLVMAGYILLLTQIHFGGEEPKERVLKITIPEDLDYDGLFDDLFATYAKSARLDQVKTTNMGTLYELRYQVVFKGDGMSKEFLDALRCRNGNLNIVCGKPISQDTL